MEARVSVRDATEGDVAAITAITNEAILNTTANWNLTPVTVEARAAWLADRRGAGFPVLVAERAGQVIGFGSFGPFRLFEGYLHTVEHGLYVHPAAHRQGAGAALMAALIGRAEALGMHVMVGAIEARNVASLALHQRFGFVRVGLMPEVGRKFDRWLDLVLMQKMLGGG
ncbi:MAG: N-acetyltransferase family protein [Acetobacteraceae bacterium]|jgi:phosphinothricin acetyltransferase|nr:N-acetyltransferase family protein [Acetobacteraceae bacterium]